MQVRFRRKRVILLVILLLCAAYLTFQQVELTADNTDELGAVNVRKGAVHVKGVREEFVDVHGKQMRKIDWHDYAFIAREQARTGVGEGGEGVESSMQERNSPKFQQFYRENGFYGFVSDNISLDRSVNDIRHPDCKSKLYLAALPSVSIVIPIRDEHLTALLRSVHSILNRTPAKLLTEIILVDDASGKESLKSPLDAHIAQLRNTRVIRLRKRQGLIRARLTGAREAKADVLVFFDSHIEVNTNWLPPLLEPIVMNYKTSVCPLIDIIKWDTFAYVVQDNGARGAFDWQMLYKRLPLLPANEEHLSEPFDNPVMAGGLFAISKKWFWELGGYDEGLDVWGGEQFEISFKIWQCGGRLIDAPCSRVGHIYRQFNPHAELDFGDYLSRNHKRVATVWMDEYAEHVYKRNGRIKEASPGDVSKQIALRAKLQCKPFKWFMEKVAFDLLEYYPPVPVPPYAEGEIRSMAAPLCIDTKHASQHGTFSLEPCQKDEQGGNREQQFELSWRQDIRPKSREACFDVPNRGKRTPVVLFNCHGTHGNQHFVYNPINRHILHVTTNLCLDCDVDSKMVFVDDCEVAKKTQEWKFSSYNETMILKDMRKFF